MTLTVGLACLLGAGAALWLLVAAFRVPKAFAGVVALTTMFSQSFQTITGISAVGYADEVCVLLAVVLFTGRRLRDHGSVRWFSALWLFLAFGLLGVLGGVVHAVPLSLLATGGFLFLKGPLLAFAVAQLDWRREDVPQIARGGAIVIAVILLFTAANAASPAAWNEVIGRSEALSERGGFTSLTGPFDHPVGLGTTMSLAVIAILAYRSTIGRGLVSLALLIGTGLACLLAFRRKSIVSGLAVAIGLRAALPGPKALYVTALAILAPIAVVLGWDTISRIVASTLAEYLTDVDQVARIRITLDSIPLAIGAFPLGVGFGRFASFTASEHYSPYYQELGYRRIWGMGGDDTENFLSDTFWPAPLAETGVLGLLCYLGGLILLVVPAWRMMRRSPDPRLRWMGSVAVGWFAALGIESVAAPVFVSPPMYGLPFLVAGVVFALSAAPDADVPITGTTTADRPAGGTPSAAEAAPEPEPVMTAAEPETAAVPPRETATPPWSRSPDA